MISARKWDRRQAPVYRVKELAKFFFGMSESWLRLKMNADSDHPETWFTTEHGVRMEFRRAAPAITVQLSDVEQMARSLLGFGAITSERLGQVLEAVRAERKRLAHRSQPPSYALRKAAKLFFEEPAAWLEAKMSADAEHPETWLVHPDGTRMEFTQDSSPARIFWLSDVEPMAYSLFRFGAIDAKRLTKILALVSAEADLYRLFDEPDASEVAEEAEEDVQDDEDGEDGD